MAELTGGHACHLLADDPADERRCGHGACPHGQPRLTVETGIWSYERYRDTPSGWRSHVWIECCSAACLLAVVATTWPGDSDAGRRHGRTARA